MQAGRNFAPGTALLLTLIAGGGAPAFGQAERVWVDPPAQLNAAPQASEPAPANQAPASAEPSPSARSAEPPSTAPSPEPAIPPVRSARPDGSGPPPEAPSANQAAQSPERSSPAEAARPSVAAGPRDEEQERRATRMNAAKAFVIRYLNSWSAPNEAALEATAEFYAPRVLFHGREVSLRRLFNEKRRFARRWPERDYRAREDLMGITCGPAGDICTVHAVFDFVAAHPARRRRSQGAGALQLVVHFIGERPVIVAEHSTLLSRSRGRDLALEGSRND